jgi:glucosamine kinase
LVLYLGRQPKRRIARKGAMVTPEGPLFLGIDAGGTHCRARLVADDGRLLGEGRSGPANLTFGVERAAHAVREAATAAFAAAGRPPEAVARACAGIGIAGANSPAHRAQLGEAGLPFSRLRIVSDAEIACRGAHAGDGAILILGTGSHGLVISGAALHAVGGWGFALSDGGSAAVLGHAAARQALAAHEQLHPASALTRAVMARHGDDPAQMLLWALAALPRDWGELAPLVFEHAESGDPNAALLLDAAVREVEAMLDRLVAHGATRIALLGGMAGAYRPHLAPRFAPFLVEPEGDALDGAVKLARSLGTAEAP